MRNILIRHPLTAFFLALLSVFAHGCQATDPKLPDIDDGWTYLSEIASKHDLQRDTSFATGIVLTNANLSLSFEGGSRRLEIDRRITFWLNAPLLSSGTGWRLSQADVTGVLEPLLSPPPEEAVLFEPLRVVLDPGHGGEDGGGATVCGSRIEKHIVLDIALRASELLSATGMLVKLTRDDDRFLSLEQRSQLAETWGADIFVSIHLNAAANTSARGIESFILPASGYAATSQPFLKGASDNGDNAFDALNAQLAYAIHSRLPGRNPIIDRGIRRGRFQVLREAPCPAVLLECGFLSNPKDAQLLESDAHIKLIAHAIRDGIIDYARRRASMRGP